MIKGKIYRGRTDTLRVQAESMLQGDMALESIEEHFDKYGETLDNQFFYYKHNRYDDVLKEIKERKLLDERDSQIIKLMNEQLNELNDE